MQRRLALWAEQLELGRREAVLLPRDVGREHAMAGELAGEVSDARKRVAASEVIVEVGRPAVLGGDQQPSRVRRLQRLESPQLLDERYLTKRFDAVVDL